MFPAVCTLRHTRTHTNPHTGFSITSPLLLRLMLKVNFPVSCKVLELMFEYACLVKIGDNLLFHGEFSFTEKLDEHNIYSKINKINK